MRNRVERLRIWLLGSAVFLLLVIAAFIGSAHYLARLRHLKLPSALGVNIVRETNGYTYCQSMQGKTVYCIHAAKSVEHTDGKIALHDVSIQLYGRKGDRNDRIYGNEFEYDKNQGVVRATGVVHIDLQAAGNKNAGGANNPATAASTGKVLHVTTSGLVYLEKLGVAATNDYIEFQAGGMTGHATGADYTSDSGVLILHSAVSMSGIEGGHPLSVTAGTAEFNDRSQEAFLTHATYESMGRTAEAERATLHSRPDGTLERIEAEGNVTATSNGATVVSQRADVGLNAAGQAQSVLLTGGVRYALDQPLRQVRGQADEATIAFDKQKQPQPQHAVFTGSVHMSERTRASAAAREPWSTRDLTAAKVVAELVPAGPRASQLQDVEATGNPHLTMSSEVSPAGAAGGGTTELVADDLKAHLIPSGNVKQPPQLDTLTGRGHTELREKSVDGIEQVSTGDTLDAKFRPKAVSGGAGSGLAVTASRGSGSGLPVGEQAADMLLSAVQQGHVTMMRRVPARSGTGPGAKAQAQVQVESAVAERAAYDGNLDRVTLTGAVQVMDAGDVLWANQVVMDHTTGDSQASGAVKVDYVQEAAPPPASSHDAATAEPTHIVADRADLERASDIATFYGKPVRLWQGGSQVQAPVIELARAQKRLIARGEGSTGWSAAQQAAQVHTVLMGAAPDGNRSAASGSGKAGAGVAGCDDSPIAKAGGSASGTAATQSAVRIASGGLIFSGILNQADFTGGFRAETADGTIRADAGTAYLRQVGDAATSGTGGSAAVPSLAGRLERVVATGQVDVQQPGLRATGERLVYTAADRIFVLTGDSRNPPKALDAQGTTTGAALRFRRSCDASGGVSVEVLGSAPGAPAQGVHTETRVNGVQGKEPTKP